MPPTRAKRAIKLFGTEVPEGKALELSAGPMTMMLDNGALRYVKLNGIEILRAIAFLVRDENWGTYTPAISNLSIRRSKSGFAVSFDARCSDAGQAIDYHADIVATAAGKVTFSAVATPNGDFRTNRMGFVVLHPLTGVAGQPVEVEEVGGKRVKSKFPALIDPVQPFLNIRALRHQVMPGVFAVTRMEGDTFEMEDHRNWTDASFKTYVRPLALPWPYVLQGGKPVSQSVTLELQGKLPRPKAKGREKPVAVSLGRPQGNLPLLAVGVSGEEAPRALSHAALLKSAGLSRLVCTLDPTEHGLAATVAAFRKLADAVGAEIALEVVIPGRGSPDAELEPVAKAVRDGGLAVESVLVTPAADLKAVLPGSAGGGGASPEAIVRAARKAFPGAKVGGGMMSFFTELNRKRPPAGLVDFVTHTTCPIVHAADDVSVMETLEALPYVVKSTKAFGGGKPYRIGPTSIPSRLNPYGASLTPNPSNGRVCLSDVDPRQRGLFGAAWTLGYLAAMSPLGLEAIAMGAATGTTGMIHARSTSGQPYYASLKGPAVYPLFHVIAGLAPASGTKRLDTKVDAPSSIAALACRKGSDTTLWLANLTGSTRRVKVSGLRGKARVATLDETAFEAASRDPAFLDRTARTRSRVSMLELRPYAVVRITAG